MIAVSQCRMFLRTDVALSKAVNVAVVFSTIVLLSHYVAVAFQCRNDFACRC